MTVLKIVENSSDPYTQQVLVAERRGAAIQKQPRCIDASVFGSYVQQRGPAKGKTPGCCVAAIQLRVALVNQVWSRVDQISQAVDSSLHCVQETRDIKSASAAGFAKKIDTGA